MYCMKCGKEIDDTSRFCPECGHQVGKPLASKKMPEIDVAKLSQGAGNVLGGIKPWIEKTFGSTGNIISMILMVFAIILCLGSWFHLPAMGDYSPLRWHEFMQDVSYNISEKIYKAANIIPGIAIWVNLPLFFYTLNLIMIWVRKRSSVAYEIAGLVSSGLIYIYARYFFRVYGNYVMVKCSMNLSFYLMVIIVFIDAVRSSRKG